MKTEPLTWQFMQPSKPITCMICNNDNEATFKIWIDFKSVDYENTQLQLLSCNSCRLLPEIEIVDRLIKT